MKLNGIIGNEDFAKTISAAEQYMLKKGVEEKMRLATQIALEEILLIYQTELESPAAFSLRCRKNSEEIRLILHVEGRSVDLVASNSEILRRLSMFAELPAPVWNYKNGHNSIVLSVPLFNTTLKNLKFAWSYARKYRKNFAIAVGAQLGNALINIVEPIVTAKMIVAFTDSAIEQIILMALSIFALEQISNMLLFFCNTRYNMVYNKVVSDIENDLAGSTLKITNACMQEKGGGLFIQRLTTDTSTLATGFNTLADMSTTVFRYVGILIAILIESPVVFIVFVVLLAGRTLIEVFRTKRLSNDDRIQRQSQERFSGFVSEMVRGASDVKTLNCEDSCHSEIIRRIEDANNNRMNMILRSWKYKLLGWEIGDICRLIYVCMLAFMIMRAGMTPAKGLVLYNFYSQIGVSAVLMIGEILEFMKGFNLSAERVCAILNNPEFPKEKFGEIHLDSMCGDIRFDHVRFRYESSDFKSQNRIILKDVSFHIPAGSKVALVGMSGCGKTTIFRLLSRLEKTTDGSIFLDGTDINMLDKQSIRGNISIVSQDPYIFHMSIRDNLRLVKPDVTEEEMYEACRIACFADDIERMPQKFDSMIGEGGVNLSGGQRQRLAIARCLLRDTPIILLDEATSALDNVTQAKIMKNLDEVRKRQTVFIIAHRLSTVVNADKILLIGDGKILDQGTHRELLSRCEAYSELYAAEDQMKLDVGKNKDGSI